MTEDEKKELAEVFSKVLEERRGIGAEQHAADHRWVGEMIERDKKREQRRERLRQQVIGWTVIASIGGLVSALGYAATKFFESIAHRGGA